MPPSIILLPYLFGCLLGLLVLPITLPIMAIYYVYYKLTTKGINSWTSQSPQSLSTSLLPLSLTLSPNSRHSAQLNYLHYHPFKPCTSSTLNSKTVSLTNIVTTLTKHVTTTSPKPTTYLTYSNFTTNRKKGRKALFLCPGIPCIHACRHRASLCSPRSLRDARWTLSVACCTSHVEQCSLSVVTCRWSPRAGRWTIASYLGHLLNKSRTI